MCLCMFSGQLVRYKDKRDYSIIKSRSVYQFRHIPLNKKNGLSASRVPDWDKKKQPIKWKRENNQLPPLTYGVYVFVSCSDMGSHN